MSTSLTRDQRRSREADIEDTIMAQPEVLGFPMALAIRNFRVADTSGAVDVCLIPQSGPFRVVLGEAKAASAADAGSKVVGQLLMYYAGALTLGSHGINALREFAKQFQVEAKRIERTWATYSARSAVYTSRFWKQTQQVAKCVRGGVPINIRLVDMSYQCQICGDTHDGLPDIGYEWPDPYFGVPELERTLRVRSTTDTCVIDEEDYLIRGVILIPVHGEGLKLGLGVWISQKRENFETYLANFDSSDIGPFFGWLSNRLPFYERDTWAVRRGDQHPE